MDHNDKRNTKNVPLGTFNEEGQPAGHDASLAGEDKTADARDIPPESTLHEANFDAVLARDAEATQVELETAEHTPILFGRAPAPPGRQRVPTLLGVPMVDLPEGRIEQARQKPAAGPAPLPPLPPLPNDAAEPTDTNKSIHNAIAEMLDDQLAVAVELDDDEDTADLPIAVRDSEITQVHDASAARAARTAAESDLNGSASGLPLLIPSQYASQSRDRAQALPPAAAAANDSPLERARAAAAVAPAAAAAATARAAVPAAASIPPTQGASSLAPREVARRIQPAPIPGTQKESQSRVGWLLVAAVGLVAAGGWLFTAGSFNRQTVSQAPAPPNPQSAAASQPMAALPETMRAQEPPPSAAPELTAAPDVYGATQGTPSNGSPVTAAQNGQSATGDAQAPKPGLVGKGRSLTATSRSPRVKQPKAASQDIPGDLPETPSRGDVVKRLEGVRSSVRACAAGRSGVADLDISVAQTGVVTRVLVGGDFAGTTEGSCIARAVREARFGTFKQERFRVLFPYAI
jgi:hypothetical protein